MSRYSYVLDNSAPSKEEIPASKIFGLFPFNSLIQTSTTDIKNGKIDFLHSGLEGLQHLAEKNYSVVLFVNQFKSTPLTYEAFNNLNKVLENVVLSTGVKVLGIYWCPNTNKTDPFVTPNAGMFNKATENQNIAWNGVNVVSSSDADLNAASKVGATPIKIGNGSKQWTHFSTFFEWARSLD